MTTIIRVKRHRGEDPIDALVFSCKRKKTEGKLPESDSNVFEYVLNFTGTVEEKNNKIAASVVESFKSNPKYTDFNNKKHVPDIKTKQRKEWKERSDDSRYSLLSCFRTSNSAENSATVEPLGDIQTDSITILDVKKEKNEDFEITENSEIQPENSFVYDLYSTNIECETDYIDMFMEHVFSIQPFRTELEYRNGEDCFDEVDPDEDDSNDENNWRNDYPDSDLNEDDDDEDEDGDYLARQFNKFHLCKEECDSSSDSGNEKYLHYDDDDDDDEKYFYYDAEDFDTHYARYKAKAIKELDPSADDNDESETTDDEVYTA